MTAEEILASIEQFETAFDTYQQQMEKNMKEILQILILIHTLSFYNLKIKE